MVLLNRTERQLWQILGPIFRYMLHYNVLFSGEFAVELSFLSKMVQSSLQPVAATCCSDSNRRLAQVNSVRATGCDNSCKTIIMICIQYVGVGCAAATAAATFAVTVAAIDVAAIAAMTSQLLFYSFVFVALHDECTAHLLCNCCSDIAANSIFWNCCSDNYSNDRAVYDKFYPAPCVTIGYSNVTWLQFICNVLSRSSNVNVTVLCISFRGDIYIKICQKLSFILLITLYAIVLSCVKNCVW